MQKNIKVAIAGVGNCASALVQGVEYYRNRRNAGNEGVMRQTIGGYRCSDVEFVAAFDIDRRKVGRPLEEAIFAKPNCTRVFQSSLPVSNVVVQAGPVLDGVAPHMADYPDDAAFRSADLEPTDIAAALSASGAEILVCYLPVGSEQAAKRYAQACLDSGVAMINCIPVFLASDPHWAQKFRDAGIPIVGDDRPSGAGPAVRRPGS
jgi:myo-inositol-1-phosphate synthase